MTNFLFLFLFISRFSKRWLTFNRKNEHEIKETTVWPTPIYVFDVFPGINIFRINFSACLNLFKENREWNERRINIKIQKKVKNRDDFEWKRYRRTISIFFFMSKFIQSNLHQAGSLEFENIYCLLFRSTQNLIWIPVRLTFSLCSVLCVLFINNQTNSNEGGKKYWKFKNLREREEKHTKRYFKNVKMSEH